MKEKKTVTSKVKNAIASVINVDGWSNFLTGLGITGRDKTNATFFKACYRMNFVELDELYRADGLARRIIDIVASEMMRQGWKIEGDTQDLIAGKLDELDAYTKITQLISLARLYGGALILMGIADGRPLDTPVNINDIQSINWLHVFDRYQCQIQWPYSCTDLNDPNYGKPDFYEISDWRTGNIFTVHHSRVLRLDWEMNLPRYDNFNGGWGGSAILPIYDDLKNYGTAFANAGVIMQDFVNGVLKIPGLSQAFASACGEQNLRRRLDFANLSKGTTGMLILDGQESFEKLSTNVSGLSDLLDRFMLAVSSVTGIPITLLFGRAPAGMNATGDADIRNFYDMIKQYQVIKLKPILEKLITYIMASRDSPLGGVVLENWNIEFIPLWQMTEEQEALIKKITAETDAIYLDRGVVDPTEIAISRFGGDRYSTVTKIDVNARENGFDPQEVAELEREKELQDLTSPPDPTIGPDDFPSDNRNVIFV